MKYIYILLCLFLYQTMFSQTTFTYDASGNRIKKTIMTSGLKTYYRDADKDGYGNSNVIIKGCSAPSGYVSKGGDCNDNNKSINPGVTEIAGNGIDDNCNGFIDESTVNSTITQNFKMEQEPAGLIVDASPNPATNQFKVVVNSNNENDKVNLNIYDNLGRLMDRRKSVSLGQSYAFGETYHPGIYLIEAVQGNKRVALKVIKMAD